MVGLSHTPFQLVYGLHVLMLIEYLLPTTNFTTSHDFAMTYVLSTRLSQLEKLEESRTLVVETIGMRQWNHALWTHNHYQTKSFSLGDHVLWFSKTHRQVQTTLVWAIQDSILFTKQYNTSSDYRQVWSQTHLNQHQQTKALAILRHNCF
jgi:hypothetical protein